MTCIAYRDGIIAADSLTVIVSKDAEVKVNDPAKVAKYKGYLFGMAGNDCPKMEDFRKWWWPHRNKDKAPPIGKKLRFEALVVCPDGMIQQWDHRGVWEHIREPFWAIGSGAHLAIGAMEAGADAKTACTIAIKRGPGVGGKVYIRKLKGR